MTREDFREARQKLGLSQSLFGVVLASDTRTVRRWESGERDIPGPVSQLVYLLLKHPELKDELMNR